MEDKSTSLAVKIGLKPNQNAYTLYAPIGYDSLLLQPKPILSLKGLTEDYDWLQVFYIDSSKLKNEIDSIVKHLSKSGQLWISWPKKSSALKSNLSDSIVRQIGLNAGLVDVKVAAIDDTWSGLKFVYRLADR
jgi:hypothetical protein